MIEIETFSNPAPQRDYNIQHTHSEWTSLCPKTGHPDFATIHLEYGPDKLCVELKALKEYYHSFRNRGIFYEAVCNELADTLVQILQPRWLRLTGEFKGRGGFSSTIVVEWPVPAGTD